MQAPYHKHRPLKGSQRVCFYLLLFIAHYSTGSNDVQDENRTFSENSHFLQKIPLLCVFRKQNAVTYGHTKKRTLTEMALLIFFISLLFFFRLCVIIKEEPITYVKRSTYEDCLF